MRNVCVFLQLRPLPGNPHVVLRCSRLEPAPAHGWKEVAVLELALQFDEQLTGLEGVL